MQIDINFQNLAQKLKYKVISNSLRKRKMNSTRTAHHHADTAHTRARCACACTHADLRRKGACTRGTFAKAPLLFLVLTPLLCTLFLQSGPLPKGPRPQSSLHPAGPQHPRARRRGVGWHGTTTPGNRGPLRLT